jgi:hypothetical protein
MLNWVGIVFILLATIIFFCACARANQFQEFAKKTSSQSQWGALRLLMIVTLLGYLVILIAVFMEELQMIANLAAIVLALSSIVTVMLVNYFLNISANIKKTLPQNQPDKNINQQK